jgi:hypothetical protein
MRDFAIPGDDDAPIEHTDEEECLCVPCRKRLQFYEIVCGSENTLEDDLNWQYNVKINLKFTQKYPYHQLLVGPVTEMVVRDRANMQTDIPDFINHSLCQISIFQLLQFCKQASTTCFSEEDFNFPLRVEVMIASFMWHIIEGQSPWA